MCVALHGRRVDGAFTHAVNEGAYCTQHVAVGNDAEQFVLRDHQQVVEAVAIEDLHDSRQIVVQPETDGRRGHDVHYAHTTSDRLLELRFDLLHAESVGVGKRGVVRV